MNLIYFLILIRGKFFTNMECIFQNEKTPEFGYVLYQLNNFYVEVKYHNERNEIIMLKHFQI